MRLKKEVIYNDKENNKNNQKEWKMINEEGKKPQQRKRIRQRAGNKNVKHAIYLERTYSPM